MVNEVAGLKYTTPEVILLQETGIGVSEYAARTCYDSFSKSTNEVVADMANCQDSGLTQDTYDDMFRDNLNSIDECELLKDLSFTYFHHSILEHINLSYLIKGISRGVLQEHARHRIQAISVRSTRYTMASIIHAFIASLNSQSPIQFFLLKMKQFDMFVIDDNDYLNIEIEAMFKKLILQRDRIGKEEFLKISVAKSSLELFNGRYIDSHDLFEALEKGPKKRNVGDSFKHLVTDNVKVDMVVTFNLRSLKNYFYLRDAGSAYFQIRNLAKVMKEVTPSKYLDLIIKAK